MKMKRVPDTTYLCCMKLPIQSYSLFTVKICLVDFAV